MAVSDHVTRRVNGKPLSDGPGTTQPQAYMIPSTCQVVRQDIPLTTACL